MKMREGEIIQVEASRKTWFNETCYITQIRKTGSSNIESRNYTLDELKAAVKSNQLTFARSAVYKDPGFVQLPIDNYMIDEYRRYVKALVLGITPPVTDHMEILEDISSDELVITQMAVFTECDFEHETIRVTAKDTGRSTVSSTWDARTINFQYVSGLILTAQTQLLRANKIIVEEPFDYESYLAINNEIRDMLSNSTYTKWLGQKITDWGEDLDIKLGFETSRLYDYVDKLEKFLRESIINGKVLENSLHDIPPTLVSLTLLYRLTLYIDRKLAAKARGIIENTLNSRPFSNMSAMQIRSEHLQTLSKIISFTKGTLEWHKL